MKNGRKVFCYKQYKNYNKGMYSEKNLIYYDKLIVNARDKGQACIENNIDLLIDDSISNCSSVYNCGIEAIMISNEKNSNNEIKTRYCCQMKDEVKNMRAQGYWRIYDCGNKVWVFNR